MIPPLPASHHHTPPDSFLPSLLLPQVLHPCSIHPEALERSLPFPGLDFLIWNCGVGRGGAFQVISDFSLSLENFPWTAATFRAGKCHQPASLEEAEHLFQHLTKGVSHSQPHNKGNTNTIGFLCGSSDLKMHQALARTLDCSPWSWNKSFPQSHLTAQETAQTQYSLGTLCHLTASQAAQLGFKPVGCFQS